MIPTNNLEDSIDKLIEECSEVIHAASKVKRFGIDNWHPDTKRKNSETLLKELLDLDEAIKDIKKYIPKPKITDMVNTVIGWFNNSSIREQQEFVTTSFEHLAIYHSNLGRNIRNYFNLWHYPWNEKLINGVDTSPDNPDAISMRVIEEVWRQLNDR